MLRVGGFPEYLPWQQHIIDQIGDIIRQNFSLFGYQHIHTPAVERNEVLIAKGGDEATKQIFGLYGLAQGSDDTKEYALHFDLTVPFARYVVDHTQDLTFPFKRWQMQSVWRGERQQKGRFKEFVQADIDTIWSGDSTKEYLYYDAETIVVLYKTFTEILQYLQIDSSLTVRISNKKIVSGLLDGLPTDQQQNIINRLDKFYKMPETEFVAGLHERCDDKTVEILIKLLQGLERGVASVRPLSEQSLFQQGLYELEKVTTRITHLAQSRQVPMKVIPDAAIVRGLDYYTGSVFETFIDSHRGYGSVCSGGRYDHLTQYLDDKKDFSGVGGSIGLDRFMSWLFDQGVLASDQHLAQRYLIFHFAETVVQSLKIAHKLRGEGNFVAYYPEPDKIKKQFSYADKCGFAYGVLCGEEEVLAGVYKIKNLKTGDEQVVPLSL